MTHAVWIVLEDEDTGEKRWWSVDHLDSENEAEGLVSDINDRILSMTGSEPEELER